MNKIYIVETIGLYNKNSTIHETLTLTIIFVYNLLYNIKTKYVVIFACTFRVAEFKPKSSGLTLFQDFDRLEVTKTGQSPTNISAWVIVKRLANFT